VAPDGYLRRMLADGARPFRHRRGVRELLGQPPDTGVRVRFAAAAPRAGFNYLSCYGDRPAGAPDSVSQWLDLVADEEPSASVGAAPVRPRCGPPDRPPAAASPAPVVAPAGPPPTGPPLPAAPTPETTVVIPGITARPDRSGPLPARIEPERPGPSGGVKPKPPGRTRDGHPAAGPVRPQPVSRPEPPASPAAPVPPPAADSGDQGEPSPSARYPQPADSPDRLRTDPPAREGWGLPASPRLSAPTTVSAPAPVQSLSAARHPVPGAPAARPAPTTVPGRAPVQWPSARPHPIPDSPVGRPVTAPQPRRTPTSATAPVPACLPARTPWTPPPAEPPAEPAVTVHAYRRTTAPRSVQGAADYCAPAPPPPAVAPPPVVRSQSAPAPAGTALFWERRHLTRRARILR
jgi:hypothetical protein